MLLRILLVLVASVFPVLAQAPSVSTYLRDGFSPVSLATDSTGNLFITGDLIVDPLTSRTGVLVVKLNPQGATILYQITLGGSGSDHAGGIAVDNLGNAFVVGTTVSADFPASVSPLTPSKGTTDPRPFLVKIDSRGFVLAANVIGSTAATAFSVAVTAQGEPLVSGTAQASGFPATTGAFSMPDSNGRPYLMKFDASAMRLIFSATGIGGTIALDPTGNIYVAGNTLNRDYPITAGAYQQLSQMRFMCFGLCQIGFPATNQYVTKVDSNASRLIYSTGINPPDPDPPAINTGLAVDAAGNAYVTGTASGRYPYTAQPPVGTRYPTFLTKLDADGKSLAYSIPQGGGSLAIGEGGDLFASTAFAQPPSTTPVSRPTSQLVLPPGLVTQPTQCLPNLVTSLSQVAVERVNRETGVVLAAQLLDGTNLSAPQIAIGAGGTIWTAGRTSHADVVMTPGALALPNIGVGPLPGAYLSAFDFSQVSSATGRPIVSCFVDGATGYRVGPVAPRQLVTIFGSGLTGAGITFDDLPASILYASDSQINLAVPLETGRRTVTVMQVTANGQSTSRQFPIVLSNPSLFADSFPAIKSCNAGLITISLGDVPQAVARNQDGEFNSCVHPAKAGSIVSFYLNGVGILRPEEGRPLQSALLGFLPVGALAGGGSAEVIRIVPDGDYVSRLDLRLPAELIPTYEVDAVGLNVRLGDLIVGPRFPGVIGSSVGPALDVQIWISR